MQYATVNIDAYTDADYQQTFRQQIGDTDYFDFTGCTLHMMIRKQPDDVEVFIALDSTGSPGYDLSKSCIALYDPGDVTPPGLYEFMILILKSDLQKMPQGQYVQSLIVERPDGIFDDLWRGTFSNTIGPTR